jgi:catechol 2,3-dioxygenase-like lactoylglutathione lyase family enzyme
VPSTLIGPVPLVTASAFGARELHHKHDNRVSGSALKRRADGISLLFFADPDGVRIEIMEFP